MTDALLTGPQVFALIGVVVLVCVLVLAEMFERAIQNDLEEHDSYDANKGRQANGD